MSYQLSYRINEGLLHPVKDHDPEEQDHQHKEGAVAQPQPGGIARTEEARPEGLDDRGHRVHICQPAPARRDGRYRVDHRGGIHPQRDAKPHQIGEIAVFCGERRDNNPKAQPHARHDQDQQGQRQRPGGDGHIRTLDDKIRQKT